MMFFNKREEKRLRCAEMERSENKLEESSSRNQEAEGRRDGEVGNQRATSGPTDVEAGDGGKKGKAGQRPR